MGDNHAGSVYKAMQRVHNNLISSTTILYNYVTITPQRGIASSSSKLPSWFLPILPQRFWKPMSMTVNPVRRDQWYSVCMWPGTWAEGKLWHLDQHHAGSWPESVERIPTACIKSVTWPIFFHCEMGNKNAERWHLRNKVMQVHAFVKQTQPAIKDDKTDAST